MSLFDAGAIAFGRVLDEGRGSLPFALVHGEALVTAATWALSEAGVLPLDARTSTSDLLDATGGDRLPLVLHDALCPMTPPQFIAECVRRAVEGGSVVVGTTPVTDTVKVTVGGLLGGTVDRDTLARVASPLVVPAGLVGSAGELLDDPAADLASLVRVLRQTHAVVLLEAPAAAFRVAGPEDLRLLEALTRPG